MLDWMVHVSHHERHHSAFLRPVGTVRTIETMATTTIARLKASATSAASRSARLVPAPVESDHAFEPLHALAAQAP